MVGAAQGARAITESADLRVTATVSSLTKKEAYQLHIMLCTAPPSPETVADTDVRAKGGGEGEGGLEAVPPAVVQGALPPLGRGCEARPPKARNPQEAEQRHQVSMTELLSLDATSLAKN